MISEATVPKRRRGPKPKDTPKAEKHLAMRVTEAAMLRFQRIAGDESYPSALNRLMENWEAVRSEGKTSASPT